MNTIDIILKKKNKIELTYNEIDYMVSGYVNGDIEDYQMSAFLMAICINGMTFDETYSLTDAMLRTGDIISYDGIDGIIVDKHSTGGVGDKVTIALAPILASLGIKIAKMSGRGLGHTGGTIDKLESIKGFNTQISEERFINNLKEIGVAISAQTKNLVPADKKLYALRDVTGTVDSIPLIASSIMSKKIASNADIISLDVKVGSGAFMKNISDAKKLAKYMIKIGERYNKKVVVTLTDMSTPLGYTIGNSLEVIEAVQMLNGELNNDFSELIYYFSSHIVSMALNVDLNKALEMVKEVIDNKKALNKLIELVEAQDGDSSYIKDVSKFHKAKHIIEVKSNTSGYVDSLDAYKLGILACNLGAGREKLTDLIDHSVGIELLKKRGDYVNIGDILLRIHTNFDDNEKYVKKIFKYYKFSPVKKEHKLILDTIK